MTQLSEMLSSIIGNEANKKKLIFFIVGLLIFIPLALWLISGDNSQAKEKLATNFEKQLEKQESKNTVPPPLLPDNNKLKEKNEQIQKPQIEEDKEIKPVLPAMSIAEEARNEQMENINKIAKTQKPSNMIVFLKENKDRFDFIPNSSSFKYELKEYKKGDLLLDWYEIELIENNYIRFKDKDYSYNLRFIL